MSNVTRLVDVTTLPSPLAVNTVRGDVWVYVQAAGVPFDHVEVISETELVIHNHPGPWT